MWVHMPFSLILWHANFHWNFLPFETHHLGAQPTFTSLGMATKIHFAGQTRALETTGKQQTTHVHREIQLRLLVFSIIYKVFCIFPRWLSRISQQAYKFAQTKPIGIQARSKGGSHRSNHTLGSQDLRTSSVKLYSPKHPNTSWRVKHLFFACI